MKTLHVTIQNKIATYQKRDGDIVCGNSDYQIEFIFDSEWDAEEKKTARFIWNGDYYDQEFTGNTCPVPVIKNASKVEVGVYAGDLETTTSAEIGCLASILCKGGAPHPESGQHYTAEAVAAAEAAKASEDKAKVSETNAKQSESNASSYASTASVHASNAAKSATEAQNSENAAAESALNAFNSEVNAYVSEQKAKRVSEEIVARVDRNDKRITNLEQGIIPEPFETDSSVAYVKDVPENALPYAEIAKVGGMTRKCTNLIPYPYVDTTKTVNGLTFTDNGDGSITVNGTAGSTAFFNLCKVDFGKYSMTPSAPSQSGYVISGFGNGVDLLYDIANGLTYLRVFAGKVIDKVTVYPMLNEGTTALPYEPYYEGLRDTAVTEIKSVGVNIFGGDALADKFVEAAEATKNTEAQTVTYLDTAIHGKRFYLNFKPNTRYTFILYGHHHISTNRDTNIGIRYTDGNNGWLKFSNAGSDSYCVVTSDVGKSIDFIFGVSKESGNVTLYYDKCGIFEGVLTEADFKPYTETSLAIPEAVQALDGYGEGNPDNAEEYNAIINKDGKWKYSHKGNIENNLWVPLATPEFTDITDLITPDNFIKVEGGGTITAVNEHSKAVPTEITYMVKEVAV